MNVFRVESYVAPILLSYVDKYVQNFNPADAQLSIWSGDVVLQNLVLKTEVLQQELSLPFRLISGRIHELHIQVPWTKLVTEPILITINTMECILALNLNQTQREELVPEPPRQQMTEEPPGYMKALVRRIVSNISLRVQHLIVKYVQDDIVLSLNVNDLSVVSVGPDWEPVFADLDPIRPMIRRLIRIEELTLCLDRTEADGRIMIFQEPLLCRCRLNFRVLTRLVSARSRRASSVSVRLCSDKLEFSINFEQLLLLLRLMREKPMDSVSRNISMPTSSTEGHVAFNTFDTSEPGWMQWAWSWVPVWLDHAAEVAEQPLPPTPCPIYLSVFIDKVSVDFKTLGAEVNSRRNAYTILELVFANIAMKSTFCKPTTQTVKLAARLVELRSQGPCVCGHHDIDTARLQPTMYIYKIPCEYTEDVDAHWSWPREAYDMPGEVETAEVVDESFRPTTPESEGPPTLRPKLPSEDGKPDGPENSSRLLQPELESLFKKMSPMVYVEYCRDRSPQNELTNPYENPPQDFEYSDWTEECTTKVIMEPFGIRVCYGLIHRLTTLKRILDEAPTVPPQDVQVNVLTVEECDALQNNLPQRRINVDVRGLCVRFVPWDHSATETGRDPPVVLEFDVPRANVIITMPLYPERVCAAACQLPVDNNNLYPAARINITSNTIPIEAKICSYCNALPRPCGRIDLRLAMHFLLHKDLFQSDVITHAISIRIDEIKVCGSAARLAAAWQLIESNLRKEISLPLRYTTLARDALNDQEAVAIDVNFEDILMRAFLTRCTRTFIMTMHTARGTVIYGPNNCENVMQSWLFSAPDSPSAVSFFRVATQWCSPVTAKSLDYIGVWMESAALSLDPIFLSWLAYEPQYNNEYITRSKPTQSTTSFRRPTPSSSSGRGASRSASYAELVHGPPPQSRESAGEPDKKDKDDIKATPQEPWWSGTRLLSIYSRFRNTLVSVETGLFLVYMSQTSASAVDCVTVRDAMERHVLKNDEKVVMFCLGRLSLTSNMMMKFLWNEIRHDGPTYLVLCDSNAPKPETFPWKTRLCDVSIYILDIVEKKRNPGSHTEPREKDEFIAFPHTVLEHVTSTMTLSVLTKQQEIKNTLYEPKRSGYSQSTRKDHMNDMKIKYFSSGPSFKPATLKEFVRGPKDNKTNPEKPGPSTVAEEPTRTVGPVISIGVHIHIDTPPINVKTTRSQLRVLNSVLHILTHTMALVSRQRMTDPRTMTTVTEDTQRQTSDTHSQTPLTESQCELIPIFESKPESTVGEVKSFLWLQWVISRATAVVDTGFMKLALEMDDIITSVDLQKQYCQMKLKIFSASFKHYKTKGKQDNWVLGALGGRIIEVRETIHAKDNCDFFSMTLTKVTVSSINPHVREDLHPKLFQKHHSGDQVTELFVSVAPLEAVLLPNVCANILAMLRIVSPKTYCPLSENAPAHSSPQPYSTMDWPFAYLNVGGIRMLITDDDDVSKDPIGDDALILNIEKITLTPHPENPICRRLINQSNENAWESAGRTYEGRQYELVLKNISISASQFVKIVEQAERDAQMRRAVAGENPAYTWSRHQAAPLYAHVLNSLNVSFAFAPALYIEEQIVCGPALELNLLSRCTANINIEHILMMFSFIEDLSTYYKKYLKLMDTCNNSEKRIRPCPFVSLLKRHLPPVQLASTQAFRDRHVTVTDDVTTNRIHCSTQQQHSRRREGDSGAGTETDNDDDDVLRPKSCANRTSSLSVDCNETNPWHYLEIYMSMNTIHVSLYARDIETIAAVDVTKHRRFQDNHCVDTSETLLEDKNETETNQSQETDQNITEKEENDDEDEDDSNTYLLRAVDSHKLHKTKEETEFKTIHETPLTNLPLVQVKLSEHNMYYWRSKTQMNLKMSLFDVWLALFGGQDDDAWSAVVLSTKKGEAETDTDIPPAVASLNVVIPVGQTAQSSNTSVTGRGSVRVDLERPIMFEVSEDRLLRLQRIVTVLSSRIESASGEPDADEHDTPSLYKLRRLMMNQSIDSITLKSTQLGVRGHEGSVSCVDCSLHIVNCTRPERMTARALLNGLLVSSGPPTQPRHVLLHPIFVGFEVEANWNFWQQTDCGALPCVPMMQLCIELERTVIDVRPLDLAALARIQRAVNNVLKQVSHSTRTNVTSRGAWNDREQKTGASQCDTTDHHYKDDLRSGAFQLVQGRKEPMAYQVALHANGITWRYPHPRAITKLIAYPLPDQNEEVECVLEAYNELMRKWEGHTRFNLPVTSTAEHRISLSPTGVFADAVYATLWRTRVCHPEEKDKPKPELTNMDIKRYIANDDVTDSISDDPEVLREKYHNVTGEMLSGILRIDSHFTPRDLPRLKIGVQAATIELNIHNELPATDPWITKAGLTGYYVSEPLIRSHRALTLVASNINTNIHLDAISGRMVNFHAYVSSDIFNCENASMEKFIEEVRVQMAATSSYIGDQRKLRCRAGDVKISFDITRLMTLQRLFEDWELHIHQFRQPEIINNTTLPEYLIVPESGDVAEVVARRLEGRVYTWIHNTCTAEIRFGQVGTGEVVVLQPAGRVAYRWSNPDGCKKLRFTVTDPRKEDNWSNGIPFKPDTYRILLRGAESLGDTACGARSDVYIHATVVDGGARRLMTLAGRAVLANMLHMNVFYKIRILDSESNTWRTITTGELAAETVGSSVICGTNCEAIFKIKIASGENGWSGDIPFKESPKEHVPWLIKLKNDKDESIAMWCRVVRLRTDCRVLISLWPLYALRSYLPLDAEVLIKQTLPAEPTEESEVTESANGGGSTHLEEDSSVPGRGTTTQLFMRGSVNTKYTLSFKYKNIARSVTDDVPLHYGTTNPSVFKTVNTFHSMDELLTEINEWKSRSGRNGDPSWPLSVITSHWPGKWASEMRQPRSDVVIRYAPVRVANGCSLELLVCPLTLLCNAAAPMLTVFDGDGRYLCRVRAGRVLAPPAQILHGRFHLSLEKLPTLHYMDRPLTVWNKDPGQYGKPPPGCIALDYANEIVLLEKLAIKLITITYEIKEEINVFGVTHTYTFINRLHIPVLIASVVIPRVSEDTYKLTAPTFVNIDPVHDVNFSGYDLHTFALEGEWPGPGTDPSDLIPLVLISSHRAVYAHRRPVPVKLSGGPRRQPIGLVISDEQTLSAVVMVVMQASRWVVTLEPDPSPQFIIHNRTESSLTVAQAQDSGTNKPSEVMSGVSWWCEVWCGSHAPFTTRSFTARYEPTTIVQRDKGELVQLTFAKLHNDADNATDPYSFPVLLWGPPVTITNGEQLVQLGNGQVFKMRVHLHLHSSLIELREVEQEDISASEIRRRLFEPNTDEDIQHVHSPARVTLVDMGLDEMKDQEPSVGLHVTPEVDIDQQSTVSQNTADIAQDGWSNIAQFLSEVVRAVASSVVVQMSAAPDVRPLLAIHLDRPGLCLLRDSDGYKITVSVADIQVDNLQYESGLFDFPVVLSTRNTPLPSESWPLLWNTFVDETAFDMREVVSGLVIQLELEKWTVIETDYSHLTCVEVRAGPVSLYVEDALVSALLALWRRMAPPGAAEHPPRRPLRLRTLLIHPLELQLTLHTAIRMYIALDQSPLRLNAFECHNLMTSPDRLMHSLTVHYLSAALLSAGWVVGGLELLGAPGALAARVSGASGGVRGVASATAAALLKSLSACAGSLARNLDLLAGDEEHARRAAAARRKPPANLVAGIGAGVSNLAINMLGAIGGLAHHPVVGVAVGENSSTTGLRRGLVGALVKPLSGTADFIAYAGHGLLQQTGWDVLPRHRVCLTSAEGHKKTLFKEDHRWQRDCVRMTFQLGAVPLVAGFDVWVDSIKLYLLLTHNYLVLTEPHSDSHRETLQLSTLELLPYNPGCTVQLYVKKENSERENDESRTSRSDDEEAAKQMSATAMARVARYTGAHSNGSLLHRRVVELRPRAGHAAALHAALAALLQHNTDTHFKIL